LLPRHRNFESCPPISTIVAAFGMRARTPAAWQVISVTVVSANETAFRV